MEQRITDLLPAPYSGGTRTAGEFFNISGTTADYKTFADASSTAAIRKDYLVTLLASKADLVSNKVPVAQLPLATTTTAGAVIPNVDQFVISNGTIGVTALLPFTVGMTAKVGYLYYYQSTIYKCNYARGNAQVSDLGGAYFEPIFTQLFGPDMIVAGNGSYNPRSAVTTTQYAYGAGFSAKGVVNPNAYQFKVNSTNGLLETYPILDMDIVPVGQATTPQPDFLLAYQGKLFKAKTSNAVTRAHFPTTTLENSYFKTLVYPTSQMAVSDSLKNAVVTGTWTSGELQGTQPTASLPDMAFCDANYRYTFTQGMNSSDTNGIVYVWTRTQKA